MSSKPPAGKAMRIAEQSADFHGQIPAISNPQALDRRVKAFIVNQFYDVQDYLERGAKLYVEAFAQQHPRTNLVFDYHVGEPLALIGGTFAFDHTRQQFASWFWTEHPSKVDGMTVGEAKAALNAFMARMT